MRLDARWERRAGLAMTIRIVIVLAPVILASGVSLVVGSLLPSPHGSTATVAWWACVITASVAAVLVFGRLFRRLLPLTVLLNLALVFPGIAPSRFSAAFRAGTVRNLQRRIDDVKHDPLMANTSQAAATVVELIAALAVHDPRSRGHSERTRAYSELLAEELGLPDADRDRLRWSALLHDIGKLHVSPSLLNKPGKPTTDEWEVLRAHPAEGARVAGALREWLGPWGMAIEQHHERFDGTGYPAGLAGDEISLGGRIVAVADAYDVMTSARTYTPPVAPAAARAELVDCAGTHFDPEIVRAFLRIAIGKLPRSAGFAVALGQVPWFARIAQLLQPTASAVAAAATTAALVTAGALTPGVASSADPLTSGTTDVALEATTSTLGPGVAGSLPGAVVAGPAPASTPASSTTRPTPATTAAPAVAKPPAATAYHLAGTPTGGPFTPAALVAAAPGGEGAPDYDSDGAPGRSIVPSPKPTTTSDPAQHQAWLIVLTSGTTVTGTPVLTISSAVAGFAAGRGALRAGLFDCDASGAGCGATAISTANLQASDWSGGASGFVTKTLTFSPTDHVFGTGRSLVLRLGVQTGSQTLLLAYGTATHPARLTLDIR